MATEESGESQVAESPVKTTDIVSGTTQQDITDRTNLSESEGTRELIGTDVHNNPPNSKSPQEVSTVYQQDVAGPEIVDRQPDSKSGGDDAFQLKGKHKSDNTSTDNNNVEVDSLNADIESTNEYVGKESSDDKNSSDHITECEMNVGENKTEQDQEKKKVQDEEEAVVVVEEWEKFQVLFSLEKEDPEEATAAPPAEDEEVSPKETDRSDASPPIREENDVLNDCEINRKVQERNLEQPDNTGTVRCVIGQTGNQVEYTVEKSGNQGLPDSPTMISIRSTDDVRSTNEQANQKEKYNVQSGGQGHITSPESLTMKNYDSLAENATCGVEEGSEIAKSGSRSTGTLSESLSMENCNVLKEDIRDTTCNSLTDEELHALLETPVEEQMKQSRKRSLESDSVVCEGHVEETRGVNDDTSGGMRRELSETRSPIIDEELDKLLEESLNQNENNSQPKKRKIHGNHENWRQKVRRSSQDELAPLKPEMTWGQKVRRSSQDDVPPQKPMMTWGQFFMYNNDACYLYRKLLLQLRALENVRLRTVLKPRDELAIEISKTQTKLYELLDQSRWNGMTDGENDEESIKDLAAEILGTQRKLNSLLHQNSWNGSKECTNKDKVVDVNRLAAEVSKTQIDLQKLLTEFRSFAFW